jgi:hypothetical protein
MRKPVVIPAAMWSLHRLTADELTKAGPRLIAVLTEPPTKSEEWHPAWRRDPMRPTVESRSRAIIQMCRPKEPFGRD